MTEAVWPVLIIWFLVWETFTLLTKEKYYPSLSRWTWRQTARWKIYLDPPIRVKFWRVDKTIPRILPLRILVFIGMSWATIHLSFGECAFNFC